LARSRAEPACSHFLAFSFEVEGPLSPSTVELRQHVPLIFDGRQPPLHENSPELRPVRTIFNRDNEVSETFANQPQAYHPIFMTDDGSVVAHEWALGFMLGVGLRSEQWGKRVLLTQHRQLLIPSWSAAKQLRPLILPEMSAAKKRQRQATAHLPIAATRFLSHRCTDPPARPATRSRRSPAGGRENVGRPNLWCRGIAYE